MVNIFIAGMEGLAAILFFVAAIIIYKKAADKTPILKISIYALGTLMIIGVLTSLTDVIEWTGLLPEEVIDPLEESLTLMFSVGWVFISMQMFYISKFIFYK